jgi:hypothetical protein
MLEGEAYRTSVTTLEGEEGMSRVAHLNMVRTLCLIFAATHELPPSSDLHGLLPRVSDLILHAPRPVNKKRSIQPRSFGLALRCFTARPSLAKGGMAGNQSGTFFFPRPSQTACSTNRVVKKKTWPVAYNLQPILLPHQLATTQSSMHRRGRNDQPPGCRK